MFTFITLVACNTGVIANGGEDDSSTTDDTSRDTGDTGEPDTDAPHGSYERTITCEGHEDHWREFTNKVYDGDEVVLMAHFSEGYQEWWLSNHPGETFDEGAMSSREVVDGWYLEVLGEGGRTEEVDGIISVFCNYHENDEGLDFFSIDQFALTVTW